MSLSLVKTSQNINTVNYSDFPKNQSVMQVAQNDLESISLFLMPPRLLVMSPFNIDVQKILGNLRLSEIIHPEMIKKLKKVYLHDFQKETSTVEVIQNTFSYFLKSMRIPNNLRHLVSTKGGTEIEKWLNLIYAIHAIFIEQNIKIREETIDQFKMAFRIYCYLVTPNYLNFVLEVIGHKHDLENHYRVSETVQVRYLPSSRYPNGAVISYLDLHRYEEEQKQDKLNEKQIDQRKQVIAECVSYFKKTIDEVFDLQFKEPLRKFCIRIGFEKKTTNLIIDFLNSSLLE